MFELYEKYDYYQCPDCEFLFQHLAPTPEKIGTFYPDSYDVYDENTRLKKIGIIRKAILKKYHGYQHLKTKFWADIFCPLVHFLHPQFEIPFIAEGKLLDVGCGNGRFLTRMRELGWNTHGVEFNEFAVSVCRKSELNVHHGDIFSANLEGSSFDIINVSHVIEHVPNPKEFFIELSRILKIDGKLMIKTPNGNALGRSLFNTNWFPNEVPRHLYQFSESNIKELAKLCSLDIELMTTRSTPKLVLNSIDYIAKNKSVPSKKVAWKRWLARIYVLISEHKNRGDELFVMLRKRKLTSP